jgi:glycine dehydrogenase subunit 2
MSMNNQGRPTGTGEAFPASIATISGDRGLDHEEALIFELGHGASGVDLPDVKVSEAVCAAKARSVFPVSANPK